MTPMNSARSCGNVTCEKLDYTEERDVEAGQPAVVISKADLEQPSAAKSSYFQTAAKVVCAMASGLKAVAMKLGEMVICGIMAILLLIVVLLVGLLTLPDALARGTS